MHKLKALSDLGWDLKTRGKTQARHSLHGLGRSNRIFCPNDFLHLPALKYNDSGRCVLKPSIPCTPARRCLWHSLVCNWVGNSSAFVCLWISWSYPLWSAESSKVIVPSVTCTSVCCPSLPPHNQLVIKKNNPALSKFHKLQTKNNIGSRSLNST